MSQNYKLRFDQMKENNPTQSDVAKNASEHESYKRADYIISLCFEWPDGQMKGFEYMYLQSHSFDPTGKENIIKLNYSSDVVIIYGYGLKPLYIDLLSHSTEFIKVTEQRYMTNQDTNEGIVIKVDIENKER